MHHFLLIVFVLITQCLFAKRNNSTVFNMASLPPVFVNNVNKTPSTSQAISMLANQPVQFIENKGQVADLDGKKADYVYFVAQGSGLSLFITQTGITYMFNKEVVSKKQIDTLGINKESIGSMDDNVARDLEWNRIDMSLKGAQIKKENIIKIGVSSHANSYYFSHCPQGVLDVYSYEKLIIKEIYPGIDWVLYNTEKTGFKYDFVVNPGADASQIMLVYSSINPLSITTAGEIEIKTEIGTLIEKAPISYQGEKEIKTSFKNVNQTQPGQVGYQTQIAMALEPYNKNQPLIIDPQLVWSSFFNLTITNSSDIRSATCDAAGNLLIVGSQLGASAAFPSQAGVGTFAGAYFFGGFAGTADAFITVISAAGLIQWSTYYGANGKNDIATDVICRSNGDIVIGGVTYAPNAGGFPKFAGIGSFTGAYVAPTNTSPEDGFILAFSSVGTRLWATNYGGNNIDEIASLTVDAAGNIFVIGYTLSLNFPIITAGTFVGAYTQALIGSINPFILVFSSNGARRWSTCYGGIGVSAIGSDIVVDALGKIVVTGTLFSASVNFPMLPAPIGNYSGATSYTTALGGQDGFILGFNNTGVCEWTSFLGGSGNDNCSSLNLDGNGNIYVIGQTKSTNFMPINSGSGTLLNASSYYDASLNDGVITNKSDLFILRFTNSGVNEWATYFGGTDDESANLQLSSIDNCNNLYIALRSTKSSDINVFSQFTCNYYDDVFSPAPLSTLPRNAFILKFSSTSNLLWATHFGVGYDAYSTATDLNGNFYLMLSSDVGLPIINPMPGSVNFGAAISKFSPTSPSFSNTQLNVSGCVCDAAATLSLTCGEAPYSYTWSNGLSVSNTTLTSSSISGLCPGVYQATLTSNCSATSITSFSIAPAPPIITDFSIQESNCTIPTGSVIINNFINGVSNYTITEGVTTIASSINTPYTISAVSPGTHTYVVSSANGCNTTFTANLIGCQILPIQLVDFNGEIKNNKSHLFWSTASEINTHYFTIKKSTNLNQWDLVSKSDASGNSNVFNSYQTIDNNPQLNEINYYKLEAFDFDLAQPTYSEIIALDFSNISISEPLIFPNPTKDKINIRFPQSHNGFWIELYDHLGKLIQKSTFDNDIMETNIDLSDCSSGIYTLKISNDNLNKIFKIIKI